MDGEKDRWPTAKASAIGGDAGRDTEDMASFPGSEDALRRFIQRVLEATGAFDENLR